MTRTTIASPRCALCGEESVQSRLLSSNGTGDFDFRPHGVIRYTMHTWISRCPHCGYCAPNIGRKMKKTKEAIFSEIYQQQRYDTSFPSRANEYICSSMLHEYSGSNPYAIHYRICAAWICDDEDRVEQAIVLREKAIELMTEAMKSRQPLLGCPRDGEGILLIDLLRRTGRFKEAEDEYRQISSEKINRFVSRKRCQPLSGDMKTVLLHFEEELIRKEDAWRHSYFEISM